MVEREDGFTLVELMVVVLIIAVLVAMGLASYYGMRRVADDTGVQMDLVTGAKVQALNHLETGEFTAVGATLLAIEPNLSYSVAGNPATTIAVIIEPGREGIDVCLFAQTEHGDWFSLHHSATDGDRYGNASPAQCQAALWGGWSREAWD